MKLRKIAIPAVAYGLLWTATQVVGSGQVEGEAMAELIAANDGSKASTASFLEWMAQGPDDPIEMDTYPYPTYHVRTYSPAPFVVVTEEGTVNGPLDGHGSRSIYVWALGLVWRVSHRRTWLA